MTFADADQASVVEAAERRRLQALVEGNIEEGATLHAEEFQLINPRGESLSKSDYLGGISSGDIRYLRWVPEGIHVEVIGDAALVRYRSLIEIVVRGVRSPAQRYWHTDVYRRKGGSWQVIWSQATLIQ